MFKKLVLLCFCLACFQQLLAQEPMLLKGLIFKKGTSQRLSKVTIENNQSKTKSESDEFGNFSITVDIGDILHFYRYGLQDEDVVISKKQNLIIYMSENLILKEVIVKEKTKQQEQKEILADFRSKGVFYNGKPPLLAYIFTPLTALNELLGKDANNARRFGNYISRENAESEVDRHFNDAVIKKAIPIKDENLVEFKYLYRPKPEDVTYRNGYDDMKYVKDCFQEYKKRKN